jgi:hypothetical protein
VVLSSISCAAKYTCTAVGSYLKEGKTKALAERYNEESGVWSVQTSATSAGEAVLKDVSCPSAGECIAVGREGSAANPKPLAERWNGSSWSVLTVPAPPGGTYSSLSKVSCISTSCMATGTISITEGGAPFAVRWDGSKWSSAGTGLAASNDVSCTASTACTSVGIKESKTLMQRWDGSKWSTQSSPNPSGKTPSLAGVSCATATTCLTVGQATSGGQWVTFGEIYK